LNRVYKRGDRQGLSRKELARSKLDEGSANPRGISRRGASGARRLPPGCSGQWIRDWVLADDAGFDRPARMEASAVAPPRTISTRPTGPAWLPYVPFPEERREKIPSRKAAPMASTESPKTNQRIRSDRNLSSSMTGRVSSTNKKPPNHFQVGSLVGGCSRRVVNPRTLARAVSSKALRTVKAAEAIASEAALGESTPELACGRTRARAPAGRIAARG